MNPITIKNIEMSPVNGPTLISDCEFCGKVKEIVYVGYVKLKDMNTMTNSDTHIARRIAGAREKYKGKAIEYVLDGKIAAYCCRDCAVRLSI